MQTPVFILDEKRLRNNLSLIEKFKKSAGVEVILAFKGFAFWPSFNIVKKYVAGATASSLNEVRLCYEEMNTLAHSYCVAYKDDEFDEITSKSSHITFNSLSQYDQFIDRVPSHIKVGLRVNPEWSDVTTPLYNPSSSQSRLGITRNSLRELPERVSGLHCHVLCESSVESTEQLLKEVKKKFGDYFSKLSWLNLGGGHLITRKGYNQDRLIKSLKSFKEENNLDIILEPGSAFAWQTGELETTVVDIVKNGGIKTAIIDASFTCHMPDCLEMPYRPEILQGSSTQLPNTYAYRLGGLSCLAGDFLDEYWFEKPLEIGHRITFQDMMHYTMVKTTMFNGIRHPYYAIRKLSGEIELIRKFSYDDFKRRLG